MSYEFRVIDSWAWDSLERAKQLGCVVMNRWRGRSKTTIAGHLSVEALREQYVSSSNARKAHHFQTIWLLAKGRDAVKSRAGFHWRPKIANAK